MDSAGENFQTSYNEAVKLLSEKNYTAASEKFSSIISQGFTSADLESNLGRSLLESGQTGLGIYHFMNAIDLDRFNFTFRDDLALAQSKVDSGLGVPMSHPLEWGNRLGSFLRVGEALSLSSLFILVFIFARLFKKFTFKLQAVFLAVGLLFIGVAIFIQSAKSLGVMIESSEVRSAPLDSSEVVFNLKAGTRIRLLRESGNFLEIERANAFRGWVPKGKVVLSPY